MVFFLRVLCILPGLENIFSRPAIEAGHPRKVWAICANIRRELVRKDIHPWRARHHDGASLGVLHSHSLTSLDHPHLRLGEIRPGQSPSWHPEEVR